MSKNQFRTVAIVLSWAAITIGVAACKSQNNKSLPIKKDAKKVVPIVPCAPNRSPMPVVAAASQQPSEVEIAHLNTRPMSSTHLQNLPTESFALTQVDVELESQMSSDIGNTGLELQNPTIKIAGQILKHESSNAVYVNETLNYLNDLRGDQISTDNRQLARLIGSFSRTFEIPTQMKIERNKNGLLEIQAFDGDEVKVEMDATSNDPAVLLSGNVDAIKSNDFVGPIDMWLKLYKSSTVNLKQDGADISSMKAKVDDHYVDQSGEVETRFYTTSHNPNLPSGRFIIVISNLLAPLTGEALDNTNTSKLRLVLQYQNAQPSNGPLNGGHNTTGLVFEPYECK